MLDQFECVRLVRMNGLDLSQFQFDYDQTWAVLFLRPDGIVLARYGTRNSTDAMVVNSMAGLMSTMQHVVNANRNWPSASELYVKKRGPDFEFQRPEAIPSATISDILSRPQEEARCIHCHNIYDAQRDVARTRDVYDPLKRWKYPPPANIGIEVDPVSGTKVTGVLPGSASEDAGLEVGDELFAINGQRIHSVADIQFVLHHLKSKDALRVTVHRGGVKRESRPLTLEPGWRESDIGWRASMYGMPPRPGLYVQPASEQEKRELGIPIGNLALNVKGVFGKEVREQLRKGDVIVQFGDETGHHTEGEFHAALRLNYYRPNAELPLKVVRGGDVLELVVRFANN